MLQHRWTIKTLYYVKEDHRVYDSIYRKCRETEKSIEKSGCLKFKSAVVSEGMWYSESKETFPNYSII